MDSKLCKKRKCGFISLEYHNTKFKNLNYCNNYNKFIYEIKSCDLYNLSKVVKNYG